MSNVQELLNKWGAKKYPAHAGKNFSVEAETYDRGFCETCSYTTAVNTVYANGIEVDQVDTDMATVLREILEANNE